MNIEKGDIIELDGNKDYVVYNKINFNNKTYYYLLTAKKPLEMLMATEEVNNNETYLQPLDDLDELRIVLNEMIK